MIPTLYFDTALTGRYHYRDSDSAAHQPHLCRLAMLLIGADGEVLDAYSALIKPRRGWTFEIDSMTGHGVHPRMANETGVDICDAVGRFETLRAQADLLAAFNYDHHRRVMLRSGHDCQTEMEMPATNSAAAFCLMRSATDIVRKPSNRPGTEWAWPKFAEAFQFFHHGQPFPVVPDPVERGLAVVRALRTIHQGIQMERVA